MNKNSSSLLEKARSIKTKNRSSRPLTEEEIELALAWANDEVSYTQVKNVLMKDDNHNTTVYTFLARALKEAIRNSK